LGGFTQKNLTGTMVSKENQWNSCYQLLPLLLLLSTTAACRFTPVPDSVLNKNVAMGEMSATAVDPRGLTTPFPGDMTPGFNTPASK